MSQYLDWKVGDRVVCIRDDWDDAFIRLDGYELPVRVPMLNEVLTISELIAGCGQFGTGWPEGVYLGFMEIATKQSNGPFSANIRFEASSFRRLEYSKTDISIFTAMLHGADRNVEA